MQYLSSDWCLAKSSTFDAAMLSFYLWCAPFAGTSHLHPEKVRLRHFVTGFFCTGENWEILGMKPPADHGCWVMLGSASIFLPLGILSAFLFLSTSWYSNGSFRHLQWPISEPKHGPMDVLCQSVPSILVVGASFDIFSYLVEMFGTSCRVSVVFLSCFPYGFGVTLW